jgi:hypothetical protein
MSITKKLPQGYTDPSAAQPAWVAPTTEALRKLSLLGDNWDTYGAPRIDSMTLGSALGLLRVLMQNDTPAPSVVPTSRGGVQLEWHVKGIDLEVEFLTPTDLHVIFEDQRTGTEWEADMPSDISRLAEVIALLLRP